MKINLVMIVKNEERPLRRCLEAAKPLVDEILITDTGSSDRTVEIAKELGLWDKVQASGWASLTAAESGRLGGVLSGRFPGKAPQNEPKNRKKLQNSR